MHAKLSNSSPSPSVDSDTNPSFFLTSYQANTSDSDTLGSSFDIDEFISDIRLPDAEEYHLTMYTRMWTKDHGLSGEDSSLDSLFCPVFS
jgi:hypothetical protein